MLRALFDYVVLEFRYLPGDIYPLGDASGWEAEDALGMLTSGKGNCYGFAALYYELVRAVGVDARACAGAVIGNGEEGVDTSLDCYGNPMNLPRHYCPHGWVEIDFDGVSYIFDPEYAYRYHDQHLSYEIFFRLDELDRARFGYIRSLDELNDDEMPTAP